MSGPRPLVQSVMDRLRNEARKSGRPFAEMLELFAVERFLHRLGRSEHRDAFVLKGALLLRTWLGADTRPTRDIDLLGPTDMDELRLTSVLSDVLRIEVEEDGIELDTDSIEVRPIRADSPVRGLRAHFSGHMDRTRLRYQVDVGQGDSLFPPAGWIIPGRMLDFPMATVLAYTPYTVIAEKLEATVQLGMANSRMKDYWDLVMLPRFVSFDGEVLVESISRTFSRRTTPLPTEDLDGLSDAFAQDALNRGRWRGFLDKGSLGGVSAELGEIVAEVRRFVEPLQAALQGGSMVGHWPSGGPWRSGKGSPQ